MSRRPYRRKPPKPPTFRLTLWARLSDEGARARRARWTGSLAVLGIRTFELPNRDGNRIALFREGVEEVAEATVRVREIRANGKAASARAYPTGPPPDRAS